jgi:hypothetical protein
MSGCTLQRWTALTVLLCSATALFSEQFKVEGTLWFQDLTVSDPFLVLPVLAVSLGYLTLRVRHCASPVCCLYASRLCCSLGSERDERSAATPEVLFQDSTSYSIPHESDWAALAAEHRWRRAACPALRASDHGWHACGECEALPSRACRCCELTCMIDRFVHRALCCTVQLLARGSLRKAS